MKTVEIQKVNGRYVIPTNALVYCNTKYHKPYLAVVSPSGEMIWQDKEYVGYGKHRQTYYVVEELKPGDLIQAAGGSGTNKYPFKGRVVSIDLEAGIMEVEELSDIEFGNIIAELKNKERVIVSNNPAIVEFIRTAAPEFASAPVLAEASAEDVKGKIVAGNLPLHLAALAAEIVVVEFAGEPPQGGEYGLEDVKAAGAKLARYQVTALA
ncbi:CRISPR-associated protein Csx16 [Moorellaceae bacterium AZ2]